jgi:uncharacterized protein (DUF58 family)
MPHPLPVARALNSPVVPLRELSPEAALMRLELAIGRRVDGLLHGDHSGFGLGPGSETADARVYQPGQDDVRRIDWDVTARTGEAHVRDLVAERELTTWALVDATASMDFGTALMEKRDLAAAVTVALAAVTSRGADRFGAHLLTTDGVLTWPNRSGRFHRLMVLRGLVEEPRQAYGSPPGLATGIESLERHRRRGLRFVVSDLLDPDRASWGAALRRLALSHRVVVIEVIDPRELDLPDVGVVTFLDPESGTTHDVDTSSRKVRLRFATAAREEREANRVAVRRAGAEHLVVSTGEDWLRDLIRFVLRARRPTRGAGTGRTSGRPALSLVRPSEASP